MNIYSSTSRQAQRNNSDGSWNVYCEQCREFITRTYLPIKSALCELCRRTLDGEIITQEAMDQYLTAKANRVEVSLLHVPEQPSVGRRFSLRAMAGEMLEALGLKKPAAAPAPSTRIARAKRRPRLFENVDLDQVGDKGKGGR